MLASPNTRWNKKPPTRGASLATNCYYQDWQGITRRLTGGLLSIHYEPMTITSLVDDYCPKRGLHGEHGLSLHIEVAGRSILFDAGQDDLVIRNAKLLDIDLTALDAVVLSHGHYDHGGGLGALYELLAPLPPPLFVGTGYSARRLSRTGDQTVDIGIALPLVPEDSPSPVIINGTQEVVPGVFILPRAELVDGIDLTPRFRSIAGTVEEIDPFEDELSLAILEDEGLTVITGCAHRGVSNIVEEARNAFPDYPLKAIVGGFHLAEKPSAILSRIAGDLAALDPEFIYCAHCTGPRGFSALSETVRGTVRWLSCGSRISIG